MRGFCDARYETAPLWRRAGAAIRRLGVGCCGRLAGPCPNGWSVTPRKAGAFFQRVVPYWGLEKLSCHCQRGSDRL